MALDDERRWLFASLRARGEEWRLSVEDDRNREASVAWADQKAVRDVIGEMLGPPVSPPPTELGPRTGTVPLFFTPSKRVPVLAHRLRALMAHHIEKGHLQLVRATRPDYPLRPGFQLPLDTVVIGDVPDAVIEPLANEHWLSIESIQRRGFRLHKMPLGRYAYAPRDRAWIDLAICDAETARKVLHASGSSSGPERHPRLLIAIGTKDELRHEPRRALPRGLSLLLVPLADEPGKAGEFLRSFARALVHDLPLHESTIAAARDVGLTGDRIPRLVADPAGNWSVSVGDAYRTVLERAERIAKTAAWRTDDITTYGAVGDRFVMPSPSFVTRVGSISPSFHSETGGLAPTAALALDSDALTIGIDRIGADDLPPSERAVDIAVRRRGPGDVVDDPRDPAIIAPTTTLATRRRYQVRVQIGADLTGSLFTERPPPIGNLLPPSTTGHKLDITLLTRDVTLTSAAVRTVTLPAQGPSGAATFDIETHAETGGVRMRVLVTHLDHILQSFVVRAEVAPAERRGRDRVLHATLEHSASARFDNLGDIGARGAAFVINDDPSGNHSVAVKRGGKGGTFAVSDDRLREAARVLRATLEQAAQQPLFGEPDLIAGSAAAAEREQEAIATMRLLAVQGAQLRRMLFASAADDEDESTTRDDGRDMVRSLVKSADVPIQIIHRTPELALPWAAVYDGKLPDDMDTSNLPVCFGTVAGAPCMHGADDAGVVCVRRFWGLRHRVELQMATGAWSEFASRRSDLKLRERTEQDTIVHVGVVDADRSLHLVHGLSLENVVGMPDWYRNLTGTPGVPVWAHNVYQVLWSPRRPSFIVLLGHLDNATVANTTLQRIDTVPTPLTDGALIDNIETQGDWDVPHSIVMLMACTSAVAAADALVGLVHAFVGAPAGAVVGTESTFWPRLSAHVATSIYDHMRAGKNLADAIRETRWELIHARNPLGLALTAFGNADLTLGAST